MVCTSCSTDVLSEQEFSQKLDSFIGFRIESAILVFGNNYTITEVGSYKIFGFRLYDSNTRVTSKKCFNSTEFGYFCVCGCNSISHIMFQTNTSNIITAWSIRN
jgi:hypothetical protein